MRPPSPFEFETPVLDYLWYLNINSMGSFFSRKEKEKAENVISTFAWQNLAYKYTWRFARMWWTTFCERTFRTKCFQYLHIWPLVMLKPKNVNVLTYNHSKDLSHVIQSTAPLFKGILGSSISIPERSLKKRLGKPGLGVIMGLNLHVKYHNTIITYYTYLKFTDTI